MRVQLRRRAALLVPLALAAVLCTLVPLARAHAGSQQQSSGSSVVRSAQFLKGSVPTTRRLPVDAHSRLGSRLLKATDDVGHLWLLGLRPGAQDAVREALKREAPTAQVLHSLAGSTQENHHWMVRASKDAVERLLDAQEHVTAALLPDDMKVSTTVDWVVRACTSAGALLAACVAEVKKEVHVTTATPGGDPSVTLLVSTDGMEGYLMAELVQRAQAHLRQLVKGSSGRRGERHVSPACQPVVQRSGSNLRVRSVCLKDLGIVAAGLAAASEVTWVEVQPRIARADLYSAVDQQEAPSTWLAGGSYPAPDVTTSKLRPFWQAGLDGKGQVVGVVDSGLDLDSCFVYDPAQSDYQTGSNTNNRVYYDASARKVVMYVFGEDDIDDTESHGTHVATSIVGSAYGTDPLSQPDMATGVAPEAQVAFVDVGLTYSNGSGSDTLSFDAFPGSYAQVYDLLAQGEASIACNSWGTTQTYNYTHSTCAELDQHAWNNPSVLQVFAAGNGGRDTSLLDSTGTVTAPGTCKNVLTVGATQSYVIQGRWNTAVISDLTYDLRNSDGSQVKLTSGNFSGPLLDGKLQGSFSDGTLAFTLAPLGLQGFDSRISNLGSSTCQVAVADPADACSALSSELFSSSSSSSDACWYLLVELPTACTIATSMGFVTADSRVRGALYYSTSQSVLDDVTYTDITVEDPALNGFAAGVTSNATFASALVDLAQQSALQVAFVPPDASQTPAPEENVASFSSYGSSLAFGSDEGRSLWYRIKPEVMAPGYILAARSDGKFSSKEDQCATFSLAGTSMATPQVTGAVILARQYFMDGYYPTGAKVASDGFTPSAALLKALLVAGAQSMTGYSFADGNTLAAAPSPYQGHGKVALWASLPLAGDTSASRPGLQVVNLVSLRQGSQHVYSVPVEADGRALAVVLAFQDWPSYPNAQVSYVNDLDLEVLAPDGSTVYFPNGRRSADPVNNVEKTYIASPSAGVYNITVKGSYVFSQAGAQPYALVVLGALASDAQLANLTDSSNSEVTAPPPGAPGASGASSPPPPPNGNPISRPPPGMGITVPGTSSPPRPPGPPGSGAALLPAPSGITLLAQLLAAAATAALLAAR